MTTLNNINNKENGFTSYTYRLDSKLEGVLFITHVNLNTLIREVSKNAIKGDKIKVTAPETLSEWKGVVLNKR